MDPVLGAELLVKMAHVEVKVLLPVKPQHLLSLRQRHTLFAGPAAPTVDQPIVAAFFIALSPAPHLTVADANDLRCLPPADLLRHRSQDYLLHLHRPLHCGPRIRLHALSHGHILAARYADISCANSAGHIMC